VNPDIVISGLNPLQADGLACVVREPNYLRVLFHTSRSAGRKTGSRVLPYDGCPVEPPG